MNDSVVWPDMYTMYTWFTGDNNLIWSLNKILNKIESTKNETSNDNLLSALNILQKDIERYIKWVEKNEGTD